MTLTPTWRRTVWTGVGGLIAVGVPDEQRVVVGSHSGVAVFDPSTGERVERHRNDDYSWWSEDGLSINLPTVDGEVEVVPCMGLKGGALPTRTDDGWEATHTPAGAILAAEDDRVPIEDDEEFRAIGFSPSGSTFIYATSPNLTVWRRG